VNGDPNLVSLAARYAVELVNLRKLPLEDWHIGKAQARHTSAFRVLVVGTDANIGKTTTALELERHLQARGINAKFVPTGQDGRLITGRGVCIDRVIGHFASGAVEKLVCNEARHADILIIEGQDSIFSPPYSGVSLALLHGSCPDAMILCHTPTRTMLRHTDVPIPPLQTCRQLYEDLLAPLHPGKVIGIALNTMGMETKAALTALTDSSKATGLPSADVVRPMSGHDGCRILADAVLVAWEAHSAQAKSINPAQAEKSTKLAKVKKSTTRSARVVGKATK
jgi:uncharacterized NAD-dependent epimerase/dehydratase family protein